MIECLIVDDEKHCLETLGLLLKEHCPNVKVIAECQTAKAGIECIRSHPPDLVFLDVEMPMMNGFEMLEQFSKIDFAIVFTTGYDQYAIKAIRFSALDYLLKPIEPKELMACIAKVESRKQLPSADHFEMLMTHMKNMESTFDKIAVPMAEGYEIIGVENIILCEADDNYTHLHLKNQRKITACRSLKEVEEQLKQFPDFVRVHHSFIVNLNEVSKYVRGEGGYLIMNNQTTVNVSRSRKEALLKFLGV
jgi:two-component system LytT family response regulator